MRPKPLKHAATVQQPQREGTSSHHLLVWREHMSIESSMALLQEHTFLLQNVLFGMSVQVASTKTKHVFTESKVVRHQRLANDS